MLNAQRRINDFLPPVAGYGDQDLRKTLNPGRLLVLEVLVVLVVDY